MIHPNVNIVNIQKRQGSRHISLSSVHFSDMGLFLSETLPKTKGTYLLCRFEPFLFFRFGFGRIISQINKTKTTVIRIAPAAPASTSAFSDLSHTGSVLSRPSVLPWPTPSPSTSCGGLGSWLVSSAGDAGVAPSGVDTWSTGGSDCTSELSVSRLWLWGSSLSCGGMEDSPALAEFYCRLSMF